MKRTRRLLTLTSLILMLSTIPVLAVFQYRWLGEVAEAERREMLGNLQRSLVAIRADLAGEWAAIRELFAVGPPSRKEADWTVLADRLLFWRENTRFPGLVSRVYAVDLADEDPVYMTVDEDVAVVEPSDVPTWVADHPLVSGREDTEAGELEQTIGHVVLPVRMRADVGSGEERDAGLGYSISGLVALGLDLEYLTVVVLPTLAAERFGATGPDSEVAVAVTDASTGELVFSTTGEHIGTPDVSALIYPPLLSVNAKTLTVPPTDSFSVFRSPGIASWVFRSVELPPPGQGEAEVGGSGRPFSTGREEFRAAVLDADLPVWRISVAHIAGSLSDIVRAQRRRNMTITMGVLVVLSLALVALYALWRRAESLADRERMFVAGISHEIRTPLAAVYSAGENLAEGIVSDPRQVKRYGSLIRTEGNRLRSMVEEILLFARLQADGGTLSTEPVALYPVVEEAMSAALRDVGRPESRVESHLPDEHVTVAGNRGALRLVFENLVANALKHNPPGTGVRVRVDVSGDTVEVRVEDDGPGMSRGDLRRVRNPFYRGSRAVADQTPGSGLGLALVDRIVRQHRGTLRITSAPGAGTMVTVELPISASPDGKDGL